MEILMKGVQRLKSRYHVRNTTLRTETLKSVIMSLNMERISWGESPNM